MNFNGKIIFSKFQKLPLAITLFLFAVSIFSDSPPSWREFEIYSSNKQFVAKVSKSNESQKGEKNWKLSVFRNKKLIWNCPFSYRYGYAGGILTDDGKFFTMVEVWYYKPKTLIDIYKEGSRISADHLTGDYFSISESDLQSTSSHFLWFDQSSYCKVDLHLHHIILTTLDKRQHTIDLNTGRKVE